MTKGPAHGAHVAGHAAVVRHVVDDAEARGTRILNWTRRGLDVVEAWLRGEAVTLCRGYAEILGGTLEIDVRVVDESAESA